MKRTGRLLSLLLVFLLIFSSVSAAALPELTDLELPETIDQDQVVRAMVLLDETAVPVTGDGLLSEEHNDVKEELEAAVPELQVVYEYSTLFSGMSVDVPYGQLEELRQVDGVQDVWMATVYQVPLLTDEDTEASETFSMASAIGQGTLIAILDTGLNLTHEAFAEYPEVLGNCVLGPQDETTGTYVSAKIPFAWDYGDGDGDVTDQNGHGTHVAGIAAGYAPDSDGGIAFSGAAPGAQLAIMKIFKDSSSTTSSDIYFAALEDAYLLGVDVINMSLGSPCGFTHDRTLDSALFGDIYQKLHDQGIIVCCAGGNSGSQADENSNSRGSVTADYTDYGVVSSPSTYTGNLSVANAAGTPGYGYMLEAGGSVWPYSEPLGMEGTFAGAFGGEPLAYVSISGTGTAADFSEQQVAGKAVVLPRGTLSIREKAENAAKAGAVALILTNTDGTAPAMYLPETSIPVILVSYPAGAALAGASPGTLTPHRQREALTDSGGYIHSTSSWGTTPDLTIAPTLSAPGTSILSASAKGSDRYRISTGTSMASPYVAGQLAVVLSWLKETCPGLNGIERADMAEDMLQSTAQILGTDSAPISVRQQGAGVADGAGAIATSVYLEEPLQELGDDPGQTGVYEMTLELKSNLLTNMTCAADRFSDVSTVDWFHKEVDAMVYLGIFNGTGGDEFSPTRQLTRAEAVTALYRMAGAPETDGVTSFRDLEPGAYYLDAVCWAEDLGITRGTGDEYFSPEDPLTREQIVTLLYRYMEQPGGSGRIEDYVDGNETAGYAQDAWRWAIETGTVTSCSDTELVLNPLGVTSRAELVVLLYRIMDQALTRTYTPTLSVFTDQTTMLNGLQTSITINTLTSVPLDATLSLSGPVTLGLSQTETTVHATITLSEEAKDYLRFSFPNGGYVEGYVTLENDAEAVHATFLGYFGDWEQAPILEQMDFRDAAAAEDTIRMNPDMGESYLNLLHINTDVNRAQLYCNDPTSSYYQYALANLGDNAFSKEPAYDPAHMSLSTPASDGDMVYAQQLLLRTRSLRNAELIRYRIFNSDTGEVYASLDKTYCGKSVYKSTWGYSSSLYWTPVDSIGDPIPDGTNLTIQVYASLHGEEPTLQWTFPCLIDSKAPEISCTREGDRLTVTARDGAYLAALQVSDAAGNSLGAEYYSDSTPGESHTLTVDLSGASGNVTVTAIDYATNVRKYTVTG